MRDPGAALALCRRRLADVHESIRTGHLDAPALHGAVTEFAQLVETMAGLADRLAAHAETDLRHAREVVADLRTTARHLSTGKLLLEPAIDDLAEYGADVPVPA
ncbi:hypothetical protein [Actinophytocola sp. KF-1]